MPGNPRLGTLRWRGRHYVCSTVDRAEQFGVEPDLYIAAVSVRISSLVTVSVTSSCVQVRQLVARHTVLEQLVMAAGGGDMEPDHPLETRSISINLQYLHIIYTISTQGHEPRRQPDRDAPPGLARPGP